jgi:hypothetical protein
MKYFLPIALTALVILFALVFGCSTPTPGGNDANKPPSDGNGVIVGGDKDEHGCIGSAGYSWCASSQKCIRVWEEDCNTVVKYDNNAIFECVACYGDLNGRPFPGIECCKEGTSYLEDCNSAGGIENYIDLHPVYTYIFRCMKKAPDAGKACRSYSDCSTKNCDLMKPIDEGACKLKEHVPTDPQGKPLAGQLPNDSQYFIDTFTCSSVMPGACGSTVRSVSNPGGYTDRIYYDLNTKLLVHSVTSGPIW